MTLQFRNMKRSILTFLLFMMLSTAIMISIFFVESDNLKEKIQDTIKSDIRIYSYDIEEKIAFVASDIFLLEDLIVTEDGMSIVDGNVVFDSPDAKTHMEHTFSYWLDNRNVYDQIRILDNNGVEMVRVNYNNGTPVAVSDGELQDKSDRYYYLNSVNLDNDTLYISKLDLNLENGEIEIVDGKYKPMLRFASTIFNDEGDQVGILIVNYLAEGLFESSSGFQESNYTNFEVVNNQGYFVSAINHDIEYGFMFDEKQDELFSKYHDYDILNISKEGITQEIDEDELYTSVQLSEESLSAVITSAIHRDISVFSESGSLFVFGEVEYENTLEYQELYTRYIIITLVITFVGIIITKLMDEILFERNQQLESMEYVSKHDHLTGLPNRMYVFDRITYKITRKQEFSLLMIDFDGFKKVNDQFGHHIGDLALKEGVKRIQNSIREDDIVARIGGDEFVVVIQNVNDAAIVERICQGIVAKFQAPFDLEGNVCHMGVSIGVVINNHILTTEQLIKKADTKMYQVKNATKNGYKM